MNFTIAAVLGLTLGQPAPDYYPFNSRTLQLPIEYKTDRKQIQQVQLFVARNGENMWTLESTVTPDKDAFVYVAREDGVYWFHIVTVDMRGRKDPPDMTREPPALKVFVDTTKPVVVFTAARRIGEEVVVEWEVRDRNPNDAATRVYYQPAGAPDTYWREVTLPTKSRNGVRFPSGTTGPVRVKVVASDLAENMTEGFKDIPAANGAPSTSLSPASVGAPATPPVSTPPAVRTGAITPPGALPPPEPLAPTPTAPVMPPAPSPAPPVTSPAPPPATPPVATAPPAGTPPPAYTPTYTPAPPAYTPTPAPAQPVGPQPVPTFDPRNSVTPASGGMPTATPPGPLPGSSPGSAGPMVEMSRAQVISSLRFDLTYQVEQRGPSGISRVDLWVTRDDGRSWVWWSPHDGRETNIKVNLDTRANTQREGLYGFRLVPVSGAGLSEGAPNPGDAPDLRVVVDVTQPTVKIFPTTSDPNFPDALVLQWEAADRNFGDEPITLEWSRDPTGPWHPVVTAGNEGVVPVGTVAGGAALRLPNTGRYPWRVPTGLPPRVFLKVTARDAAGNTTEQVTREPLLIDRTKPRAKITGIGAAPVLPRP